MPYLSALGFIDIGYAVSPRLVLRIVCANACGMKRYIAAYCGTVHSGAAWPRTSTQRNVFGVNETIVAHMIQVCSPLTVSAARMLV